MYSIVYVEVVFVQVGHPNRLFIQPSQNNEVVVLSRRYEIAPAVPMYFSENFDIINIPFRCYCCPDPLVGF
jgi:hypothetical protein